MAGSAPCRGTAPFPHGWIKLKPDAATWCSTWCSHVVLSCPMQLSGVWLAALALVGLFPRGWTGLQLGWHCMKYWAYRPDPADSLTLHCSSSLHPKNGQAPLAYVIQGAGLTISKELPLWVQAVFPLKVFFWHSCNSKPLLVWTGSEAPSAHQFCSRITVSYGCGCMVWAWGKNLLRIICSIITDHGHPVPYSKWIINNLQYPHSFFSWRAKLLSYLSFIISKLYAGG